MIIGHERQLEYLNKAFQKGRMAHAYLFYGPEHVGKFTVAQYFSRFFDNPEVFILDREHTLLSKKEERKDIPIEDIRELKRLLSLAPEGGRWRIVVINEAEKLSPPAADAFLKLLEEPGTQTVFILVTSSHESLPQTIVSRSQPIRFSLVPEKILDSFLAGKVKDAKLCRVMLVMAAGRPGVLLRFLEDKEYWAREKQLLEDVVSIVKGGSLPDAFIFSEKTAKVEELREKSVEYIMRVVRQKMLEGLPSGNTRADPALLKKIWRISNLLDTTNVNPRLALDSIFLEVLAADS